MDPAVQTALQTAVPFVAAAFGLVLALLGLGLAGWVFATLVARTLPARVRTVAEEAQTRADEAIGEVNGLRHEMAQWVEQLETLNEQLDRRRKQLTSAATRLERAQGGEAGEPSQTNGAAGAVEFDGSPEAAAQWAQRLGIGRY